MIKVNWLDQSKTIIRWSFPPSWTWAEFHETLQEVNRMIDTVDGVVDSIIVPTNPHFIPSNALTHLRQLMLQRHQRHGIFYVVAAQPFVIAILNALMRIMPYDNVIRFARDEQDALALQALAYNNQQQRNASSLA